MSHNPGDRIYLTTGQAALYVAPSGIGHLVEPLYIDPDTGEEVTGDPERVSRVHASLPKPVMEKGIAEAEARLAELRIQTLAARAELSAAKREAEEHEKAWAKMKTRVPALAVLDVVFKRGERPWIVRETGIEEITYRDERALNIHFEILRGVMRVFVSHNDWRGVTICGTKEEAEAALLAHAESAAPDYALAHVITDYPHLPLSQEARARGLAYQRENLKRNITNNQKQIDEAVKRIAEGEAKLAALDDAETP